MIAVPAVGAPPAAGQLPHPAAWAPRSTPDGFAALLQRVAVAAGRGGTPGSSPAATAPGPAIPGLAGRSVLDRALLALGRTAPGGGTAGPGGDPAAFVAAVFDTVGVVVPGDAAEQSTLGVGVGSLAEARTGDLVVLGDPPGEVGLYAGRGRIVHAPADGGPVRLSEITGPVAAIRRIVTDPESPAPPATPAATRLALLGSVAGGGIPGAAVARPVPGTGAELSGVPFGDLFARAGADHRIEPALLAAVAGIESGFDPRAVSPAGAQGLMQFMPATAASLGVDPWDPASAIPGAARYLRQGLDRFGSVDLALAAYNAGPGAVQRHGGIPPYRETQDYVRKVLERLEQYRR